MRNEKYTIRSMTNAEMDLMIDWAATEGWNPGLHDANCYFAADPEGFLVGFLGDEQGLVLALQGIALYGVVVLLSCIASFFIMQNNFLRTFLLPRDWANWWPVAAYCTRVQAC